MLELLRREPDVRSFRAGETIFSQGDSGEFMYAVLEGEIAIRRGDRVLEQVGPGGIFGEMALIDNSPRAASAIVESDCRVAAVGKKRFVFLVQQAPFFALEIMHILADRLRRNTES